jgi:hypothetical protein
LRGFAAYQLASPTGATKNVAKTPRFSQEDSLQFFIVHRIWHFQAKE